MEPHLAQMINQEERNKILENMFREPREREREREKERRRRICRHKYKENGVKQ
jgi:hypothetical protein